MPSVLDVKFKYEFKLPSRHRREVQQYLEKEVGYRTYVLRARIGGKKWFMSSYEVSPGFLSVGLDDDGHAALLALKFAGQ